MHLPLRCGHLCHLLTLVDLAFSLHLSSSAALPALSPGLSCALLGREQVPRVPHRPLCQPLHAAHHVSGGPGIRSILAFCMPSSRL